MLRKRAGTLALILFAFQSHAAPISGQGTWETTLLPRDADPNTPGIEAYYDTDLNITWIADANLAATNTFGVPIYSFGMSWSMANEWIAAMNTAAYLGYSDWRLTTVADTGTPGCNFAYSGTDCGYSVDLTTGAMAHMFYSTLGNTPGIDTSGVQQPCYRDFAGPGCLTNTGPFSNLQPELYWSGTADPFWIPP